jgi:hypothetical protein
MVDKLGVHPSDRYYLSWLTQRFVNFAPEENRIRNYSGSEGKQVFNPAAQELQKTIQQMTEERENMFLSSANPLLLDYLYKVRLSPGMDFTSTITNDDITIYNPPRVFVFIDDTEYEITQAKKNNIETLYYEAIPSRIEMTTKELDYAPVLEETLVDNLYAATFEPIVVEGFLYITLKENTTWEKRMGDSIYFSKVFIKGITRKGTETIEVIPLRYNGTFRTINQWKEVTEVYTNYVDDNAKISIDSFSWLSEGILDSRNLNVDINGEEKYRFLNIKERDFGYTFTSESYTTNNFDLIRAGINSKDIEHEIELLDSDENNITINAFAMKPHTDLLFCATDDKILIYDTKLQYPNMLRVPEESSDPKIDIYADKWIYHRGEEVSIKTRILNFISIPYKFRFILDVEGEEKVILNLDGTTIPFDESHWIDNEAWSIQRWQEKRIDFSIDKTGTHVVTMECFYSDEETSKVETLSCNYIIYTPSIEPENEFALDPLVGTVIDMSFDDDGNLWLLTEGIYKDKIKKFNIYYDYFMVDYQSKTLWLKEQYEKIRVDIDV